MPVRDELEQAHAEATAWRCVRIELEALCIDVLSPDVSDLRRALARWGEEVAALRAQQPEPLVREALGSARRMYRARLRHWREQGLLP